MSADRGNKNRYGIQIIVQLGNGYFGQYRNPYRWGLFPGCFELSSRCKGLCWFGIKPWALEAIPWAFAPIPKALGAIPWSSGTYPEQVAKKIMTDCIYATKVLNSDFKA